MESNVKFANAFEGHDRVRQNPGNSVHVLYAPKILEDGTLHLVESGREDIYESIQSHKDSCDIHVLLARYRNGETDVLSKVQGTFGDFTEMPKTYADLLNSMVAGENLFYSLPVETRAKFDHSLEKFIASMDNMPDWLEKMGYEAPPSSPEGSLPGLVVPSPGSGDDKE